MTLIGQIDYDPYEYVTRKNGDIVKVHWEELFFKMESLIREAITAKKALENSPIYNSRGKNVTSLMKTEMLELEKLSPKKKILEICIQVISRTMISTLQN
ncbi:MAG TPA: hypothetical protein VEC16_04190 [Alphaproteobacteria bacterium]|nr:hypothetical protein [Alphaproteobacteria bacterium]